MAGFGYSGSFGRTPIGDLRGICVVRPDFVAIERFIRANRESKEKVAQGLDLLVRSMALLVKGFAQKKSGGPVAPRQRSNPALAYRIPVQRITGAYFAGWTLRKLGNAHWLIYNPSREAILIETGMFMKVRRPILKLSLIAMLRFLESTRTEQRFLKSLVNPRRDARGRFASIPMGKRLQGTSTLGGMAGPVGKLP